MLSVFITSSQSLYIRQSARIGAFLASLRLKRIKKLKVKDDDHRGISWTIKTPPFVRPGSFSEGFLSQN